MHRKLSLIFLTGFSATVLAGTMGPINKALETGYHPFATVFGGAAWSQQSGGASTYIGTDSEKFIYRSQNNASALGYGGVIVGFEHRLFYDNLYVQLGAEYDKFAGTSFHGSSLAGVDLNTSTLYQYQYHLSTQQAMGTAKFFSIVKVPKLKDRNLYPYFSVGLGAAFNKANQFTTSTLETGSINLTPTFASSSNTNFSYNLGVGIEMEVIEHLRLGLGYRYSNFGKVALGQGVVSYNQYRYPANYVLGVSNAYANQLLAGLTYVV